MEGRTVGLIDGEPDGRADAEPAGPKKSSKAGGRHSAAFSMPSGAALGSHRPEASAYVRGERLKGYSP